MASDGSATASRLAFDPQLIVTSADALAGDRTALVGGCVTPASAFTFTVRFAAFAFAFVFVAFFGWGGTTVPSPGGALGFFSAVSASLTLPASAVSVRGWPRTISSWPTPATWMTRHRAATSSTWLPRAARFVRPVALPCGANGASNQPWIASASASWGTT